jgi:hypothetical protein
VEGAEVPEWQKEIGAITLFVEDLGRSKAFYQDSSAGRRSTRTPVRARRLPVPERVRGHGHGRAMGEPISGNHA